MKQMTKKHNETGRSMVEMLGVLAVVGVLSIGGVTGYRYAVDKMNANEIINELKKRAITASQQRVLGQDINLAEYGVGAKIKGTYTVTPTKNYDGNASQFALAVAGVPERVCDMILESDWALPTKKVVANGSCVDGGNILTFAFNNTLESGAVVGGNGEGNEGNNDPTDTPTQQCGENEYRLADGSCQLDTNCSDPNQFWNPIADGWNGACVPCPTEGNPVQNYASDIEDSCTKCTNAQQDIIGDSFYCIWCPSNRVICGDTCCEAGEQCQYKRDASTNWNHVYTCVSGLDSTKNECLTNADCNKNGKTGEYCQNARGCGQMIGTCQPATLDNGGATLPVGTTTVVRSADRMGWDAAKNFCAAHNMSLLNLRDYCTDAECSSIQSNGRGSCTNLDVTDDSNWIGWTGTASGSCTAYNVTLSSGAVNNSAHPRDGLSYFAALCVGS